MMPDRILVLANSYKNELITLGINPKKIIITTTMVESKNFEVQFKKFEPPYTLLFCSRIEESKGIYNLLDAFQLVVKKYPDTKIIFLGEGRKLKKLRSKIYYMNLEKNIQCVGYKSGKEKIDYFKKSGSPLEEYELLHLKSVAEQWVNQCIIR